MYICVYMCINIFIYVWMVYIHIRIYMDGMYPYIYGWCTCIYGGCTFIHEYKKDDCLIDMGQLSGTAENRKPLAQ